MTQFKDDMKLKDARALLRTKVDEGEHCPCCTQFAKVYKRKINSTNARLLIKAYRLQKREWFHAPTFFRDSSGGEWARLVYWGLAEEETTRRPDGGRAGWWRLTPAGVAFALDQSKVLKYARIYDGRLLGLVGEQVGIKDALGLKFKYDELMAGI